MVRGKKRVSALSLLCSIAVLLICLICGESLKNLLLAILSVIALITVNTYTVKINRSCESRGQISVLMTALSLIFVALYCFSGMLFGYERVVLKPSFMLTHVLPTVVITVCAESIRRTLLVHSKKMPAAAYILFAAVDVSALWYNGFVSGYSATARAVGTVILPSLFAGILYDHVCQKYGALPNILYKSVIFTYMYFLPFRPVIPDALLALVRIVLPLAAYLFIVRAYEGEKLAVGRARSPLRAFVCGVALVLSAAFILLASGISRYKLTVIGSESMSGVMNKGDMVIYEGYSAQELEVGQIILFERDGAIIVHRISDIKSVNGETRYYTKGDANDIADEGYITDEQIVGVSLLPLKYVGYPTVWLHELIG